VKSYRQRVGKRGETIAEAFLHTKGLITVARNVRTPIGEIDLLLRQGDQLVFVEVKTRTNLEFGQPEESINARKLERMIRCAEFYVQHHPETSGYWRIDVVAILGSAQDSSPEIEWFENVAG
jgi:putative endonuclease